MIPVRQGDLFHDLLQPGGLCFLPFILLAAEFNIHLLYFRKILLHVTFGYFNQHPGGFALPVHEFMKTHAVNDENVFGLQDIFLLIHENGGCSFQDIDQFQSPVVMRGPVIVQIGIGYVITIERQVFDIIGFFVENSFVHSLIRVPA